MTDYDDIKKSPLAHLDYFTEWGPKPWQRFVEIAIRTYLKDGLAGKRVLEIGPRWGRMSCLFALLGARVTAIDIRSEYMDKAFEEVRYLGLAPQIDFVQYSGDLGTFRDSTFDLVFTKSVLIHVPNLPEFLAGLNRLLRRDGRAVFIENARGGRLIQFARRIKHARRWDYSAVNFFTTREAALMRKTFSIDLIMKSRIPPVYLFCGRKRCDSSQRT